MCENGLSRTPGNHPATRKSPIPMDPLARLTDGQTSALGPRAGFLTSAARGGADEQRMMEQSGHRSIEVARRYIRRGKIWDEHPAYRVGL
jgi:hypothetical protein